MATSGHEEEDIVDLEIWFETFLSSKGIENAIIAPSKSKFSCDNNCPGLAFPPFKTKCNHLFCRKCTKLIITNERKCIKCHELLRLDEIRMDNDVKNEILNLLMRCPYESQGCKNLICIRDCWDHVIMCAQSFAPVDCPWKCGEKVQLNRLRKHFRESCNQPNQLPTQFASATISQPVPSMHVANQVPRPPRSRSPFSNRFRTLSEPGAASAPIASKPKEVRFTWPLKNYRALKDQAVRCQILGKGAYVDSRLFTHPMLNYGFMIRIYLNGTGNAKGTHVSLFLGIIRNHNKSITFVPPHKLTVCVKSQCKSKDEIHINIIKSLEYEQKRSTMTEIGGMLYEFYGFRRFCEQTKIEQAEYLKNDCIRFEIVKSLTEK